MKKYPLFIHLIIALIIAVFVIIPANFVYAENESQAQLEQELRDIQTQIDQFTIELSKTQTQKASLANKIRELQTKQKSLNLQIQKTVLQLAKIKKQLTVTENTIEDNLSKQQKLKIEIGVIIRTMNTHSDNALIQLLTAESLSDAFNSIRDYEVLTHELIDTYKQSKTLNADLAIKQNALESQKSETNDLLKISAIQKQTLNESLGEQSILLTETKGLETNFQTAINDNRKRATAIRNRIYELFNTGKQIDFGQAVDIAKWAGNLTGVRPALLLAILTQESNLGKNVGTCNRAGDPETKSWKVVMKPTRDQEPFQTITKELGLDIDTTPVSCPMKDKNGKQVGWGGAMGPAQFIPSTWMGYKDKVGKLSGKGYANPWDIRDAFLASAIKLKSDGADGTEDGEWKAALKYFAGSVNLKFRFYADNVIATAEKYQTDINQL